MKLIELKKLLEDGERLGTLDMEQEFYCYDPETGSNLVIENVSLYDSEDRHSGSNPLVAEMRKY